MNIRKLSVILVIMVLFAGLFTGCKNKSTVPWNEFNIDSNVVKELQTEVDNGHRVGEMDPVQVTDEFLTYNLGIKGELITGHEEIVAGEGEKGYRSTLSDGRIIEVILYQPIRKDQTGIWVVKRFRILSK